MNNGFNGTGTAFIFYVLLAIVMPLVLLYRMARHRKAVAYRFVMQHFITGVLLTAIALLLIGFAWHKVELTAHGELHSFLVATAWLAIGTLGTWIVLPRLIRISYRLHGRSSQLHYKNPNIHPWLDEWYSQLPPPVTPRSLTIDKPIKHYGLFPTVVVRNNIPLTVYVPVQRRP